MRPTSPMPAMMLVLLEQAYTSLMNVAEPGYKDW
ncbi:hypothetical protein BCAL_1483 [Bifidobacterium callitrichos DSM 23973]|uniref:Uncharacterized protein n=1 Tax=Bifidobacterium callitrichos DSM 23973 TaxID=1437609 RepID=A0A087A207_9BIFI|nr:hypothetical protein BCAL_1483 [Bifidobacterium callitrichos DSM 23973]